MSRLSSKAYYGWILLLGGLWLLYFVSPIDLLPDVFPGLGWVDDLVALVGLYWFSRRLRAHMGYNASSAGSRTSPNFDDAKEDTRGEADAVSPDNPWQVLQLAPGASAEQIHAAYKQLLLKYHPDRVAHLGEEFQRLAHRKTLAITQAYARLKQQA